MTATTAKYVRVLWELKAPVEDLETAVQIYRESPELQRVLTDPSVYKEEKHAVVDRKLFSDFPLSRNTSVH